MNCQNTKMLTKKHLTINELPKDKLPEFWDDNVRINALYAPFRDRSVNPRDWDSKLNFWRNFITTWCNHNQICVLSENELKQWFISNGRVPACLNIVLNELYRNQEIQNVNKFLEVPQKSWSGWAIDLVVKKPLKWSFNKVKDVIVSPIQSDSKFVHLPTIEKLSHDLFLSVPEDKRNKILTIDDLSSISAFKNINTEAINLLLHYLQCNNKADVLRDFKSDLNPEKTVVLVKFGKVNSGAVPINNVDVGKYTLEQNETFLIKKIEELEDEITAIHKTAKSYLNKGMRQMAKTSLRKQHEFERRLEKQVSTLSNVQELLARIGTAESDGEVLDSYRQGLAALKSVFKVTGLTENQVDDTMVQLNEVLESHDDIQTTLSQNISTTTDAELEDELAELLSEESSSSPFVPPPGGGKGVDEDLKDLKQRLKELNLPSVPVDTPNSSPIKNVAPSV